MAPTKSIAVLLVAMGVRLLLPAVALAQPFIDDFEDGSATDGNPVRWVPADPSVDRGTAEVVDGDFLLTPSPTAPPFPIDPDYIEIAVLAEDRLYQDVSIHTQVRVSGQEPYWVGVVTRDTTAMSPAPRIGVWMFLHVDDNSSSDAFDGSSAPQAAGRQPPAFPSVDSDDRVL